MPRLINTRCYTGPDPLDKAGNFMKYTLLILAVEDHGHEFPGGKKRLEIFPVIH
jgi:hypothetical protein